ncbi:PilN family type IVB pilus formation outer membrane protein [Paraburkholderia sp. NMBU_R16]|uniref:PilN family type IVB pilus formation outer membrane protein n=1 Tax=Paraburkholderia sp. NMBU_R16 TaxID=2698676 RepID=UPI001564019A|nr:PilN family type IVB pilus formation outer membrane protein [Paraburkholderia sp. NMBU_R16]NRO98850.1 PilN family type IVB pilus formation outer membrane protein [Paraburkholderia sp. NMBU_R16]
MHAMASRVAIVICVSLLAGCTGLIQKVDQNSHGDAARADRLLGDTANGNNTASDSDAVVVKNQLWLSGSTLKIAPNTTLPKVFDEPASFDGTVDSIQSFADRISRLTHMPAKVAPQAIDAATRATQSSPALTLPAGSPGANPPPLPGGLLQSPPPGAAGVRAPSFAEAAPVHIAYTKGTLRGLLDIAAARFGIYWKYADGSIVFFYTDTRVYQVVSIPGDSKLDTNVVSGASNNGGASSGGGAIPISSAPLGAGATTSGAGSQPSVTSQNSDNIAMNAQLSVYNGLQAAVKAMLSPVGSVIIAPATGSITVTDTPDVLARVGEFMEQQNQVLARQVLVNVTVLSVTLSASDSYGINWSAVYQALGTKFGITSTFSSLVTGANQFSATVITPSSRASATNAVISALSQQGTVRRKTSASVTTLNDQPVPVQVAEQTGYLAQISTTATLNVGTQTSLTPGTVTTGFNMTLLPHILNDGTVMMQFYTNISSLASLTNFTSGGETIQLPTVDTRNFLQRVAVKSGQTLVISGYEGTDEQGNRQGTGTPSMYALGGGVSATQSREVLVILISPIVMNGA